MSQENVEFVRGAFGVVTIPGDPDTMIAASHPDFDMHLIGVAGEPVHYAGASGIREFFRDVAQSWDAFRFEASRPPRPGRPRSGPRRRARSRAAERRRG